MSYCFHSSVYKNPRIANLPCLTLAGVQCFTEGYFYRMMCHHDLPDLSCMDELKRLQGFRATRRVFFPGENLHQIWIEESELVSGTFQLKLGLRVPVVFC